MKAMITASRAVTDGKSPRRRQRRVQAVQPDDVTGVVERARSRDRGGRTGSAEQGRASQDRVEKLFIWGMSRSTSTWGDGSSSPTSLPSSSLRPLSDIPDPDRRSGGGLAARGRRAPPPTARP